MTIYLRVRWSHDRNDDPIELYHEVEEDQRESRRVELFEDGRLLCSDEVDPSAPTSLSLEPFPSLDEIRVNLSSLLSRSIAMRSRRYGGAPSAVVVDGHDRRATGAPLTLSLDHRSRVNHSA
jgi:hypothetical protein